MAQNKRVTFKRFLTGFSWTDKSCRLLQIFFTFSAILSMKTESKINICISGWYSVWNLWITGTVTGLWIVKYELWSFGFKMFSLQVFKIKNSYYFWTHFFNWLLVIQNIVELVVVSDFEAKIFLLLQRLC